MRTLQQIQRAEKCGYQVAAYIQGEEKRKADDDSTSNDEFTWWHDEQNFDHMSPYEVASAAWEECARRCGMRRNMTARRKQLNEEVTP